MKNFFYSLICLLALFSCSGGSPENEGGNAGGNGSGGGGSQPQVKLDVTSSDFTVEGGSKLVTFTSSTAWTASVVNGRATSWCKVEPVSGAAGNASITITTTPNDTPDDRTASVVIKAGSVSKSISVSQKQKDALTVTSSKFELSSKGGEVLIEVKANVNFECEVDEASKSWITYSGTRALKTSSVVLNVSENEGLSSRSGKVYIKSNGFEETVNIYQAGEKPSIVISQKEYTISSDGGTIAVDVSSNVDVEVVLPSEADWIKENATRSTSTHTYRFDVAPSEEYNQRSAEIKFINKENNLAEIVTVTQTQKDALVLAKDNYNVDNEGGSFSIEIGHNVDFDVSIDVDWITQSTSRSFGTSTLVFNVEANPDYDSRSGVITFTSKDGCISQIVKVYQAAEGALIISQKDMVVGQESGSLSFEIQSNLEFTVSAPDVDWLRPVTSRGLTTHTLRYEYDANTSYESRVARIIVTDIQNNQCDTLTVTQAQKDALVLAKESYTVDNAGGSFSVEIGHNVDFDVSIDVDWITQSTSRSFGTSTLVFNVEANPDYDSRSGVITFTSKDGSISQSIVVEQDGQAALIVGSKEITLDPWGGIYQFEVQTNVEFTVSVLDADWMRPLDYAGRGLSYHYPQIEYDANTTYEQRVGKILVTDVKNHKSDTITVTQTQNNGIILGKDVYQIDGNGGQLQIEVNHNIAFDVQINDSWITQTTSRALDTSILVFNVEANPDYDTRCGSITFTSKDGSVSQTVIVEQAAADVLIIGNKEISVDFWGGIFHFEVQTNVEFTVSVLDADWMRPLDYAARGLSYHYPQIEYDENPAYEQRVGKILVTDTKNNKSDTITVTQAKRNAIISDKDIYQVDGNGGQLQIEVSHNVDFYVQINDSWISQSTSRALDTSTLVFNVEANPDNYTRWGSINLVAKDGSVSQTITVEQAEGDYLNISCKEFYADSNSGGLWIDIQSNVPFSVSDPDVSWLRVVEQNHNTPWHSIYVEYNANTSYESRVGKIIVTDLKNNRPDTITITQAQKEAILLSETNYKMSSKSGQLQIKVDHNVEFDVAIDVDWITLSTSRALGTSVLVFNVAENATQKDREGTITFTSRNGAVTQKVKVLQKNASFDPSIDEWEDDDEEQGGTAE